MITEAPLRPTAPRHFDRRSTLVAALVLTLGLSACSGSGGETGAQGPTGPQGVAGPAGPQGAPGLDGPQGPMGPAGPQGLDGTQGLQGPQGNQGLQGSQGLQGPQGLVGAQGPIGLTGPTGPAGTFVPPAPTSQFFFPGTPTLTHYTGLNWVLETPDGVTLRLRQVGGGFFSASMIHPTPGCTTPPSAMVSTYATLSADGQTLEASFCGSSGGSTILVSVIEYSNGPVPFLFTCIATGTNGHVCQRH